MQTKNDNKDAQALRTKPADGYEVTPATAGILDCLRACNAFYTMIDDAMQIRYGDIMTPEEVEQHTQPYLKAIDGIADMLHAELRDCVVDALSDANNTAAEVVRL